MRELVLIGAGGHCKSCIDVIENEDKHIIYGVLDKENFVGERILGYPIIGTDEFIEKLAADYDFLISVGQILDHSVRKKLYTLVQKKKGRLISVISPSAKVSRNANLGDGTIVMHGAGVNSDVKIGNNCIINTFSNIEHDVVIGDHCHISTGAILNGGVIVGDNCFIGSGAIIAHNIDITPGTVIGAGGVVLKSIRKPGVYLGNPAKFIREI